MPSNQFRHLNLLIVGDQDLLSPEFRKRLFSEGIAHLRHSASFRSAIATIRTERFDCIFVDRELEGRDGIILAPIIKRCSPRCASILFATDTQWATVEAARQLGFDEVIPKGQSAATIYSIFERALTERGFTPATRKPSDSKVASLSIREREILMDIATGATTIEIAAKRHNSVATIKSHLTSIYRKLEVRNRVEAIALLDHN